MSLWSVMFASSTQFFILTPLLPFVGRDLCIAEGVLGTLVGVYALALGVSALFAGFLSDRIGRRKILLFGSGFMAFALMCHGLAVDYYSLLVLRLLTGISGGVLTGSCIAYVRDYFPYEKRGWANGVVVTGGAFGQIGGIPAGILLADQFGFSSPFVVLGLVMAGSFFLINRFVPQPFEVQTVRRVGLLGLLRGYQSILRFPFYRRAALGYVLMFFSVTMYLVYFPQWIEQAKGASAMDMAWLFLIGGGATLVGGPMAGRLADQVGRIPVTIATSLSLAGAMGISLFFRLDVLFASFVFFLVMLFLAGRSVSYQSEIADRTIERDRGKTMNLMIALGQIGMAVGSTSAGWVFTKWGYEVNTSLAVIASVAMAVLVSGRWVGGAPSESVADSEDLAVESIELESA
ncbi:MAG: MFS transporter [Bacteroidota bacterium]